MLLSKINLKRVVGCFKLTLLLYEFTLLLYEFNTGRIGFQALFYKQQHFNENVFTFLTDINIFYKVYYNFAFKQALPSIAVLQFTKRKQKLNILTLIILLKGKIFFIIINALSASRRVYSFVLHKNYIQSALKKRQIFKILLFRNINKNDDKINDMLIRNLINLY